MNTIENRIDRSVKLGARNTVVKNGKGHLRLSSVTAVEGLKHALVKRLAEEYSGLPERLLVQSVNEAHALASLTPVPLLVFPELAQEKVRAAAAWAARQDSLLHGEGLRLAA